jgi:PAS domain S-box-containing protein
MQAPGSDDRFRASLTEDGRYRLLVEAVTDYAIYMLDPDGSVTSWNAGARLFKGYEAPEILGEHFSRFYTEEDRRAGRPERALATAAREGRFEGKGWRVRKDGTRFWASVVIDRISDPGGSSSALPKSPAILPSGGQPRRPSGAAKNSSGAWYRA